MEKTITDIYKEAKGYITPHSKVVKTNYNIPNDHPLILQYLIEVPEDVDINDSGFITFVCVYATYISIKCLPTTKLIDKEVYIKQFLDTLRLTRFNQRTRRTELIWRCYLYHRILFEYRVPRYSLKDLERCLQSQGCKYKVIYEKFINSEDIEIGINSNWHPRDYQEPIIQFLSNINIGSIRGTKLQQGFGKNFSLDTLIKVPNGWKMNRDIRVNDIVTAYDGTPCRVMGVYPQGVKETYEVTFWDGRKVDCGGEHLWKVYSSQVFCTKNDNSEHSRIINTNELKFLMDIPRKNGNYFYVPLCKSEQAPSINLPMDPYILGVLLGDGGIVHGVQLSTDKWIIENIEKILPESLKMTYPKLTENKINYFCRGAIVKKDKDNKNEYVTILKELGLYGKRAWEKFIPDMYLYGSHEQRLALIQGLLDTDGCMNKPNICRNGVDYGKCGTIEFSSSSKELVEGLQYLIRSIGGIAKISIKEKTGYTYNGEKRYGRICYRLFIRYPNPKELFRLPRKKDKAAEKNQYSDNLKLRIKSIEYVGTQPTQCIAIDHPEGLYIVNDFIVTHNTSISIFTLDILKKPTMIVCAGLVEQWLKNVKDITIVDEKDIFVIQGSDSIHKLFKEGKHYKIYIASLGTLRSWITNEDSIYTNVPSYEQFLHTFEIGTKIIDEFHLNFAAIIAIDLRSNIESNIYLSATPVRADKNANKIFNTVFPYDNIIGMDTVDRYVNTTQYKYSLHIPQAKKVVTQYGYSHTRYEAILLSREEILRDYIMRVIKPLVDAHYINKFSNGKLLIFASTVALVMAIHKYFSYYYEDKVVNTYVAQDPKENLEISDIIISTPKSCGVGVDIKNLVCVINTVTVSSEALVKQMFGRLRKLPDGRTPEYVDIYNDLIPSQIHHGKTRFKIYRLISKNLEIFKI